MLLNECRSLRVSPRTVPEYHHCTPLVTHMSTMKVFNKRVSSRHIRAVTSLSWYQKMVKNSIFQWFLLKCRLFQNVKTSYIYFPFFFLNMTLLTLWFQFAESSLNSFNSTTGKSQEIESVYRADAVSIQNVESQESVLWFRIGPQDRSDAVTFWNGEGQESDRRTGPML